MTTMDDDEPAIDDRLSSSYPRHFTPEDIERLERCRSDPGWNAALHLLTCQLLVGKPGIWTHVDPENGIDFEAMLEDTGYMSGGEYRLIRIAASCYTTGHPINLHEVLTTLSARWLDRVFEAMQMVAGS